MAITSQRHRPRRAFPIDLTIAFGPIGGFTPPARAIATISISSTIRPSAWRAHERILPLAGLTWAAVGKDPGFSPLSILELLKRRGHPRPGDVARLVLAEPFDLTIGREAWRVAIEEADRFARSRPADEAGCLYYSPDRERFDLPQSDAPLADQGLVPHWGRPGGILPRPAGGT